MENYLQSSKLWIKVAAVAVAASICTVALTGCLSSKQLSGDKYIFDDSEWNVTFNDDFNGNSLDTSKWKTHDFVENDNIRRAGYYDHDAVSVSDGKLTIRTDYRDEGKYGKGWYTGWVESSVKAGHTAENSSDYEGFAQKGGYFEVTAQAPPSEGIWSAFWLMPDSNKTFSQDDIQGTATDGTEIDIMESPHYNKGKSITQGVLHWDGYDDRHKTLASDRYHVEGMYTEMHTYGLEWTEDSYIFYIDGYKIWETDVTYEGELHGVSDIASYMLLTVEIGGSSKDGVLNPGIDSYDKNGKAVKSWAGNPMDNDTLKSYDFIIDNIRVMTRK